MELGSNLIHVLEICHKHKRAWMIDRKRNAITYFEKMPDRVASSGGWRLSDDHEFRIFLEKKLQTTYRDPSGRTYISVVPEDFEELKKHMGWEWLNDVRDPCS